MGFTLNPLAPLLGPIQAMLQDANIHIRVLRRLVSWDDRMLTFQLCIALAALSLVALALGVVLMYVPWARVFEWTFRLVGALLFGPHMIWVGRRVRASWADF